MKEYDVHGTVTVVVHMAIKAESGEKAIEMARKKFKGVHAYLGNGGSDKLIGVSGENESITIDGNVEFDDYTER